MNNVYTKKLSVKAQTLATAAAVISAVALPQLFHFLGAALGFGPSIAQSFLPMHLPVILVALFAGSMAGGIAGFLSPLISFALSGMPSANLLPFMMIELCAYGVFAGLLRNNKMPTVLKVLITQVLGRAVRAVAILGAVYLFNYKKIAPKIIYTSIYEGIAGILLQLIIIPIVLFAFKETKND